jgi:hypothetical protein
MALEITSIIGNGTNATTGAASTPVKPDDKVKKKIGATYHYNDPNTTTPSTKKKVETITRKDPTLGKFTEELFGLGNSVSKTAGDVAASTQKVMTSLDRYSRNLVQTLFSHELAQAEKSGSSVSHSPGGIQKGVSATTETLDHTSAKIKEALKPVSTALGSTLGTLTGVLKDPMGAPALLSNTMSDIVKKVNPSFANKIDASFKKTKMDNLSHMPEQMMGSIRNVMMAADAILSVPLTIISDLYNGLMNIMKEISSAVDQLMASVTKLFFGPGGLLDSIVPIGQIMSFLDAVGEFSGQLTGISQVFTGANQIAGVALQAQSFANNFGSFLQNPMDMAAAYMPPQLSQGLYALQNPQAVVNQFLHPQLSQGFAKMSQITGFGFNGNMGFGLESVMSGLKGGVVSSVVGNFANQYAILTPLLNFAPGSGGNVVPNKAYPPAVKDSAVNPNVKVAQGIPQPLTPPPKIL